MRDETLKKKLRVLTYVVVAILLVFSFFSIVSFLAIVGGFVPAICIDAVNIIGLGLLMRFKIY